MEKKNKMAPAPRGRLVAVATHNIIILAVLMFLRFQQRNRCTRVCRENAGHILRNRQVLHELTPEQRIYDHHNAYQASPFFLLSVPSTRSFWVRSCRLHGSCNLSLYDHTKQENPAVQLSVSLCNRPSCSCGKVMNSGWCMYQVGDFWELVEHVFDEVIIWPWLMNSQSEKS